MALTDLTRLSTSGIATGTSLSGAILHGDAYFRGDQVGVNSAFFDSSERRLDFKDNVKLRFGDSGDLSLSHNINDSVISHSAAATGSLKILSGGAQSIECIKSGAVEIAHNGSTKIETTSTGTVVTGVLTATSFSGPIVGHTNNTSGISTFYDLRVSNNLTVEGTTTTLDTNLVGVDRIEVGANSNTVVGVAITQSGTADIINLFDGSTEVLTVADGGKVGINSTSPTYALEVDGGTQNTVIALRSTDAKAAISFLDNTSGGYGRATIGGEGDAVYITSGAGIERLRIDSNGALLTAGVTAEPLYPHFTTARKIQAEIKGAIDPGNTRHHGSLAVNCTNSNSFIGLVRRDNTQTDGTDIGVIGWTGFDGTDFHQAAAIMVKKGAGAGNDDQPGHLIFKTNSGTTSATEKLRIQSTGQILYQAASGDNTITSKRTNAAGSNGNYFFHLKATDNNDNVVGEFGFHRDTAVDDSRFIVKTRNTGGSSAERLRIDSSGRIGIDYTPGSGDGPFNVDISGSNNIFHLGHGTNNDNYYTTGASGTQYFRTPSANQLVIKSDGDVGIGTDIPSYRLQVHDSDGSLFRVLTGHESTYDLRYVYQNSEANIWSYGSTDLTFGTRYNKKLHLVTNGPGKRLTIDGSGDVGIGNDSPNCRLAVKDVAEHTAYANVTPSVTECMLQLYNNPPNETANDHATIQFGVNGGSHNRVNTISAVAESAGNRKMAFTFCTDEAGSRSEKMRITGDGKVGIGSAIPQTTLDVYGELTLPVNNTLRWSLGTTLKFDIYSNNGGNLIFRSLGDEKIRIDSNGCLNFIYANGGAYNSGTGANDARNVIDLGTGTGNKGIGWGGTNANYANIWTEYSTGALHIGMGIRPTGTSTGWVSSYGGGSIGRSALKMDLNGDITMFTASGSQINAGSATNLTQKWFLHRNGDLTHQFAGRHGHVVASTDGSGAYFLLDGEAGGAIASGSDYMYMEHTSTGQFEMWNGKTGTTVSKFMDVSPEGWINTPKQPHCSVTLDANRTISSNGVHRFHTSSGFGGHYFTAVNANIGGHYDSSNSRFTVPVSGRYLITMNIAVTNSSFNAYGAWEWWINGARGWLGGWQRSESSGYHRLSSSTVLSLTKDDYLEPAYEMHQTVQFMGSNNDWEYTGFTITLLT